MMKRIPTMDLRASILDFKFDSLSGGETSQKLEHFTGKDSRKKLEQFLDKSSESNTTSKGRRLFIIETAINEETYPELEPLITAKLGASQDIFKRHRWRQTTFRFNEVINCPRLPTTARPRRSFSLEYFELWQVEETNHEAFDRHNPMTVKCASTQRQIQCYKWMKSPGRGWLLVAPRKCSFWSRQEEDGWKG